MRQIHGRIRDAMLLSGEYQEHIMEENKFSEMLRNARLMRSTDPDFAVEKLIDFSELDDEQKSRVEKEFKKKAWIENSLFYNYYENDSF